MKKFSFFKKKKSVNYSKEHQIYVRKLTKEKWIIRLIQVLILVAFFVLWEVLTMYGVLDPFFISSPSRMIATIEDLYVSGELFLHIGTTLYETVIGFILATAIGYLIAVILWWSERLRRIFDPYIVVLNSLPKIALGPLIIIWFGAGTTAIIVMCILICVIITTLSLLGSFLSCDKDKILLMKSMNAKKYQIFFKLIVPNSMGDLISVLKINVGKVLDELGVKDYSLDVADIGSAQSIRFDVAVTSVELAGVLSKNMKDEDKFRVLAISNFVDKNEMKEKVKTCLEQLGVL